MDGIIELLTSITCWDHFVMKINDWVLLRKYCTILRGKGFLSKDIMANVTSINFYYLFSILGDYEKVIEYYTELLHNEEFIDDQLRIVLIILIGYNYFHLFEFDNALFHYDIALSSLDDNHILREQNNYEDAIIYQEQADLIDANDRQISEFDIETSLKYFQNQLDNQSGHSPLQRVNTLYSM
ncbi:unnamed protein product, partial [Rotaria sordida]